MTRPDPNDINNTLGLLGLGSLPDKAPVAAFNVDAIKNLINTKGIVAYHYKHAPNPDRTSLEVGTNINNQAAQRAIRYYSVRELRVVPQSFKLDHQLTIKGLYDIHSVVLNVSGNYSDGDKEHVYCRPRDLIVLNPSITVMVDQMVEWNPTGPIKLNYKVKGVDYIASAKKQYKEGKDFIIKDYMIHWVGKDKPSFVSGKGEILTIVYWATPVYIVQASPHVFRILPSNPQGNANFPRKSEYAPQLVIASQSHLREEQDILDFSALPDYTGNATSLNTTGGT
jgi:hypothetical protein